MGCLFSYDRVYDEPEVDLAESKRIRFIRKVKDFNRREFLNGVHREFELMKLFQGRITITSNTREYKKERDDLLKDVCERVLDILIKNPDIQRPLFIEMVKGIRFETYNYHLKEIYMMKISDVSRAITQYLAYYPQIDVDALNIQ